jgi:hypothetical protein
MTNFELKEKSSMKQQDNEKPNNQQSLIEDLTVNEDQAAELKGGPFTSFPQFGGGVFVGS